MRGHHLLKTWGLWNGAARQHGCRLPWGSQQPAVKQLQQNTSRRCCRIAALAACCQESRRHGLTAGGGRERRQCLSHCADSAGPRVPALHHIAPRRGGAVSCAASAHSKASWRCSRLAGPRAAPCAPLSRCHAGSVVAAGPAPAAVGWGSPAAAPLPLLWHSTTLIDDGASSAYISSSYPP